MRDAGATGPRNEIEIFTRQKMGVLDPRLKPQAFLAGAIARREFPMNKLLAHAAFAVGIIASPAVMAAEGTITLAVNNMYRAACPSIVKSSLEAVAGVAKVAVSYKDKTATVIYDNAKANVNQLTSATTKAGYPSAPKS
jgi:periplasmic mercuric ion binding protein